MAEQGGHSGVERHPRKPRNAPFRIFLSYRREDAPVHVGRLWDALRYGAHGQGGFPKDAIFKDVDTIEPGVDFRRAIANAVQASDVFLAVIGPHWLSAANEEGGRRLDDPGDYVRLEIEAALQRAAEYNDVRVVPIRVGGAAMPGVRDLPGALQDLAHRNAVELTDARWNYDIDQLLKWLKELAERRRRLGWRNVAAMRRSRWRHIAAVHRRRWWRVAAATVAAALLVAMMAIATGRLSGSSADTLVWERVDDESFNASDQQVMSSIVDRGDGEPRYVVGGSTGSIPERDGAIWTSDDGRRWDREPSESLRGSGDQAITAVYRRRGGGVRAVGINDGDIAEWQSEDGRDWRTMDPNVANGTGAFVYRVDRTSAGLLGAGWSTGPDQDASVARFADDGRVDWLGRDSLGGPGKQHMNRIVQAPGSKAIVGVGVDDDDAGVWISRDQGRTWQRVADGDLGGEGRQDIRDAVRVGARIVAVGLEWTEGEARGVVWRTADGENWEKIAPADAGPPAQLHRVFRLPTPASSDEPTLAAAGVAGHTAAVWSSQTGTEWQRVRDPSEALGGDETELRSIRDGQFPLIAVGSSGLDAAVWLGTASDH